MAHYAILDENNIVVDVLTGRDEDDLPEGISDWEEYYREFHGAVACKRTSYNTHGNVHADGKDPFRANYAEVGGVYDADADAFILPQPHASWTLDTDTYTWMPPSPEPAVDIKFWDEDLLSWMVWDVDASEWVQYTGGS